jgi:small acid-soluble spore protein H (minor)
MNVNRAEQIINAGEEIVVHYNGVPVWIQTIDKNAKTARVYTREQPDDEHVIPLDKLTEQ